ncbi:MAG: hypothetical protein M1830_005353 [Pleopsidium flavum]|nr:MAG: hypothetical protein M1830_005353 [Pleopsidium flavum]
MATKMNVLLFGDQTSDCHAHLRRVLHQKENIILTSFLERVSVALRDEVSQQPRLVRERIPDFTNVTDLAERYHELESPNSNPRKHSYVHLYSEESPSTFVASSDTLILGLCTGLLAASAVASSKTLASLTSLAVVVVRIAFRTGILVDAVAQQLAQSTHDSQTPESWSAVVAGMSEAAVAAALDTFHKSKGIPVSSQAYISAISIISITISGPPSTLKSLFAASDSLKKSKTAQLPVHGSYHASHLYDEADVREILRPLASLITEHHRPRIPVLSTITGARIVASSIEELFEQVLLEILKAPLHWGRVIQASISEVIASKVPECQILEVGPSSAAKGLVSALKLGAKIEVSLEDQMAWLSRDAAAGQPSGKWANPKIAIVGMAGRFPNAASLESFWALLEDGLDVHRRIPKDRFDADAHFDPTGKRNNTSHTPFEYFIDKPGLFDPRFFNMSPREAAQTDPMQRLALITAFEALEMAGYVPNRTPSTKLRRIGTFYGQTSDDWREVNAAQKIDTYFIPGGGRAFAPGRINYHFKFSGPSFSIDTACSSSFAAIQLACTSLWSGDCDTAVAGGLNVLTAPDIFAGLSRGDGIGTVILKRLEDAEADKDNILGVILGSGTNHSAEAVSITQPHAGAQEFLSKKILDSAGVDAHEVSYVELHGTGTQAGDGPEMRSVTNVFAPEHRRRHANQPLHLGAVKTNAGHGEAAAGVNSLIKVLLMLRKDAIPRHVGIKGIINQGFPKNLDERNVQISFKTTTWLADKGQKRRVFLNNFSAAGGNTALLLEDAPLRSPVEGYDPRSTHVVSVSAESTGSLERNIKGLISYIDNDPMVSLPSLSYTTTARRIEHNYRVAFAVSDAVKLKTALTSSLSGHLSPVPAVPPKVAFIFTGQGSHYPALGKQFFKDSQQFRSDILRFDNIGQSQGLPSFLPLIDGTVADVQTLSPVIGIKPSVVLGHSLGEYAALNVAGVLSATGTHAMLAIKASVLAVQDALSGEIFEIACINDPEETVLSAGTDQVSAFTETLTSQGFKCTKFNVPFAFHSAQVDPILDTFGNEARAAGFNSPSVPVISPLLHEVVRHGSIINSEYLCRHAREPVDFLGGIITGQREKVIDEKTIWVEIGPHPVCSAMVKSALGSATTTTTSLRRNEDSWKTITTSLCLLHCGGLAIDWSEVHRDFDSAHQLLRLPSYSFDEQNYWLEYTNNWCLTKGDITTSGESSLVKAKPALSTTSVQPIVREDIQGSKATIVIESDLSDPDLHAAVTGHLVNGAGLCPSSIYADMALTIANYLHRKLKPDSDQVNMNVCNMEVHKPLIARSLTTRESQVIQITATADLAVNRVDMKYESLPPTGNTKTEHAECFVEYGDATSWLSEWARNAYWIQPRIEMLKKGVQEGRNHRIHRGLAYKPFSALVQYDDKYRGMEEVILDSEQFEATSQVAFQTTGREGDFFCSPYWIDSLAHLSGFIVNGTDAVNSKDEVYVSHGWKSLQIARPLSASKSYRSYVKMQPDVGKIMVGDVYVFEEEIIIAVVGGLKFQCIPRSVLNILLPPPGAPIAPKAQLPAASPQPVMVEKKTVQITKVVSAAAKPVQATSGTVTPRFLDIIVREIEMQISDLVDDSAFADLGVNSLLSLTITGKIREELDIEVPSSLFAIYPTVADLKEFLLQYDFSAISEASVKDGTSDAGTPDLESGPQSSTPIEEKIEMPLGDAEDMVRTRPSSGHEMGLVFEEVSAVLDKKLRMDKATYPPSTSVLLQGNPKTSSKILFLFLTDQDPQHLMPSSLIFLPRSVFMASTPQGPYCLGGWSAGGVVAFEVAHQLLKEGETISRLVLIDSPCPIRLELLPSRLHHFFDSIGLLGSGNPAGSPGWLLPHFESSIANLTAYKPDSMDPKKAPKTTDFGFNGWDKLLGAENISTTSMAGNHFTMMRAPLINDLSSLIKQGLE